MCKSNISSFAGKRKRPSDIHLDSGFFDPAFIAKISLIRAKDQLNAVERDFLLNIQFVREPSPKQLAWLEAIAKKAGLDWRSPR